MFYSDKKSKINKQLENYTSYIFSFFHYNIFQGGMKQSVRTTFERPSQCFTAFYLSNNIRSWLFYRKGFEQISQ